ncbi:MAG: nucleotidyltransferase family protein [Candidatus Promineifilaceae bacterium]|nr:nucleotidyltransferase family protein [Candidatus Promineifilaceae bacterium]
MNESKLGPWPDLATARSFLGFLAETDSSFDMAAAGIDQKQVALWLVEQGIAPLAYERCKNEFPDLVHYLQHDTFSTVAENSIHWQSVGEINGAFSTASIPAVLLKGAALAQTVYPKSDSRTMSDVDVWIRESDVELSCQIMTDLGYLGLEKNTRPLPFQLMVDGEIQFHRPGLHQGLVELHLSPFSGWWLKRTSAIDNDAIWARNEPLPQWPSTYQLSAEDSVIHVAVHMTVNHQCGFWVIRSLMDLALTANKRIVNWDIVAERANNWRVGNAVWLALNLLQQLVGVRGLEKTLNKLLPPTWKRQYILKLVNPESVILGSDLRSGRMRYLLLLLLVDRYRDTGHLVYRTLWPEKSWLNARYGESIDHWQHLNRVIRLDQS